jgi:hypothetical protein
MPIRRAIQRDEPAIRRWRDEVWPELLNRTRKERRTLVFADESGFYLLPGLVRTYAPPRGAHAGLLPAAGPGQSIFGDHVNLANGPRLPTYFLKAHSA